jgi:hypothetical protein
MTTKIFNLQNETVSNRRKTFTEHGQHVLIG